ncbi:DUF4390 domain-containing protein [Betaproteobacteria bacterium PRO7]|jgi:hypothetical protein|nr:DUF4390 domain-containing protein [Betaproteobacteria bacterium PRO7]
MWCASRPNAARAWPPRRRGAFVLAVVLALSAAWLAPTGPAAAQGIAVAEAALRAPTDGDGGALLDAQFDFELPAVLEDAVNRGIALYFVIDFELYRTRWYWFDRKLVGEALTYRLTYSPLTRQYRLARGTLAQPFDTLAEALATLRRVRSWKVVEAGVLHKGEDYRAQTRMRLDISQLPKPFQINALTNRDWNLASDWRPVPVPPELMR